MSQIEIRAFQFTDPEAEPLVERIGNLFDQLRQRAYELSKLRAGQGFHELDDWLQAETLAAGVPTLRNKGNRRQVGHRGGCR